MLDTGLRLSEVASLTMANAHIDEGHLKVMGKGAKERIGPIGGLAQRALLRYVYHFRPRPLNAAEDNLFLTLDGTAMSGNAVQRMMSRLSRMSGVDRLHPHLCHHTVARNYLVNGGDIFTLQQILSYHSGNGATLCQLGIGACEGSAQEVLADGQDGFEEGQVE